MSEPANPNRVVQIRELARKLCEATSGPPDSFLFWPAPGTLGSLIPWDPAGTTDLRDIERSLADRRPRQFPAWTFFTVPAAGIVAALEAASLDEERVPVGREAAAPVPPLLGNGRGSGLVNALQEAFSVVPGDDGFAYIRAGLRSGDWMHAPEARGPFGQRVVWRPRFSGNPGIVIKLVGEGELP